MKKTALIVLSLALAILLASCQSTAGNGPMYDSPLFEEFIESPDFDMTLLSSKGNVTEAYLAHAPLNPWKENAIEVARDTQTLRFYFMCASGISTSGKWGDSCLIVFPNGQTMLVDSGMEGFGPHLMRNLVSLGISKIDYLMFSHCHDDHAYGVLNNSLFFKFFEIGECFWCGAYASSWSDQEKIVHTMESHNIRCTVLSQGDEFSVGDVRIRILEPVAEDFVGKAFDGDEAVNGTSIVMRIDYKDNSALFCGDLYSSREQQIIKELTEKGMVDLLDVDILKTPHHGGNTSSSKEFVEATSPYVAVSMGSYPMDTFIYGRYAKLGAYCLMDTIDGYVRVVSDGSTVSFETSKERETNVYVNLDAAAQKVRDQR